MKKIIVLTAAFFMLAVCKADAYTLTRLQVHSYDNAAINVYIDGNAYGNGSNFQSIENLAPGYHEMQVTEWVADQYNNSVEQTIFTGGVTLDQGYTLNTVVNPGNNLQVIDEVAIYEPQSYRPVVAINFHPYVVCGVGFYGRYYHAPATCYVRPHYEYYHAPVVCASRGWDWDHDRGYHGYDHHEYHENHDGGYHRDGGYHNDGGGRRGGDEHHENYSHNMPHR